MSMTRAQKQALAYAVVDAAATVLIEGWDEAVAGYYQELSGIHRHEAAQQIANWLGKLPTGGYWHNGLPEPANGQVG